MAEKHYDAFISYRHNELDRFVAEKMQRQLEFYKLPGGVKKKREGNGKKKIERIFRDKDELPLSSNLSDPIIKALQNSDYLIVICSPRLPQSQWCKLEIDSFIAMHGREKVLAVLAEGEPEESFPEQLLHYDREVILPDGTVTTERVNLEPLAADVRGESKAEILKKIKQESFRILAAMFEIGYSDLKQRHREGKFIKAIGFTAMIALLCLIFGAVNWGLALQIQQQADQLEAQSAELAESNAQIQEQYWDIMISNETKTATEALNLSEQGQKEEAIDMLLEVMPSSSTDTEVPNVAATQQALTNILGVYDCGLQYRPVNSFSCTTNVVGIESNESGNYILAGDDRGSSYLFSLSSNEIEYSVMGALQDEEAMMCGFIDDTRFYYFYNNALYIYDIEIQEIVKEFNEIDTSLYSVVVGKDLFTLYGYSGIYVFDKENLEVVWSIPEDLLNLYSYDAVSFSPDGKYFIYVDHTYYNDDDGTETVSDTDIDTITYNTTYTIHVLSVDDWNEVGTFQTDNCYFDFAKVFFDKLIVGTYNDKEKIECFDIESATKLWESENDCNYMSTVALCTAWNQNNLVLMNSSTIVIYDYDTGELKEKELLPDIVIDWYPAASYENIFMFITQKGSLYMWNMDSHIMSNASYSQIGTGNYYSDIEYTEDGYALSVVDTQNIIFYNKRIGENVQAFTDSIVNSVKCSKSGNYWAMHTLDENCIYIYSGDTNELVAIVNITDSMELYSLVGDDYLVTYESDSIKVYNIATREEATEYSLEDICVDQVQFAGDGSQVVIRTENTLIQFDVLTGETNTYVLKTDEVIDSLHPVFLADDMAHWAVLNDTEGVIEIYNGYSADSCIQIKVNCQYVEALCFGDNGMLAVKYDDGTLDIYDYENQQLISTLNIGADIMLSFQYLADTDEYFLQCEYDSYLLNADMECKESIPCVFAYLPKSNQYFLGSTSYFLVHKYSYDDLMEEARNYEG